MDKRAEFIEEMTLTSLLSDFKAFSDTKAEGQLFNRIRLSESDIQNALVSNLNQKREELKCQLTRSRGQQQDHHQRSQGHRQEGRGDAGQARARHGRAGQTGGFDPEHRQ